jgi:hypothetical protein
VSDLVDVTATGHPEGQSQGLVALSAALHALLLAPTSGLGLWRSWLNLPGVGSALGEIEEAVAEFGTYGPPLRRADLQGIVGAEQREREVRQCAEEARTWLERAAGRRSKMKRASDVWAYLVRHDLSELLLAVAEDQRAAVQETRSCLLPWGESRQAIARLHEIDADLTGRSRLSEIVGGRVTRSCGGRPRPVSSRISTTA